MTGDAYVAMENMDKEEFSNYHCSNRVQNILAMNVFERHLAR